jgi:hypothetical protein
MQRGPALRRAQCHAHEHGPAVVPTGDRPADPHVVLQAKPPPIIQQEQTAKQTGSDLASLRQESRNAMDWDRWSWFTKLAEATRPTRLPSLLPRSVASARTSPVCSQVADGSCANADDARDSRLHEGIGGMRGATASWASRCSAQRERTRPLRFRAARLRKQREQVSLPRLSWTAHRS